MPETTSYPDFSAYHLVCLMLSSSGESFHIARVSTVTARRRLLDTTLFDVDASQVFPFKDKQAADDAVLASREAAAKYRLPLKSGMRTWFAREALAALEERRLPGEQAVPLRQYAPVNMGERAKLEAAEGAARKARELQEQLELKARIDRQRAEQAREEKESTDEELRRRVGANDYLAPGHLPPDVVRGVTGLLGRLNVLCNGHCELRRTKADQLDLDFYFRDKDRHEVATTIEQLRQVLVLSANPGAPGVVTVQVWRPFPTAMPAFPRPAPNTQHRQMHLSASAPEVRDILLALKPGIRGWDLPLDIPLFGFDPMLSRRGSKTPPSQCPVLSAWLDGAKPGQRVSEYFAKFGLTLGWEPPALRFLETSPYPEDEGAPLLMLRLMSNSVAMGFQKIRLDTGAREVMSFTGRFADEASAAMWRRSPDVLVAPCLEDAIALQSHFRQPCLVVTGPTALAALELPVGTASVRAFLPALTPVPWLDAVAQLTERAAAQGIQIDYEFPEALATCRMLPYPAEWAVQFAKTARAPQEKAAH